MIDLGAGTTEPVAPPARDGVDGLGAAEPTVVSVSDVHGYLDAARSALTALGDHPEFDPLVRADDDGRLHWAGDDEYVLVFNGDLIDRGPDNEGVIDLVARLIDEAPTGHVRVTLGNHEWGTLLPAVVQWDEWFSGQRSDDERRRLCSLIEDGHVVAAYRGYSFTYAHAGQPDEYDASGVNEALVEAAGRLSEIVGGEDDGAETQFDLIEEYRRVLGLGRQNGRGFGAGIAWLDFRFLPGSSPPQIVGHTRQDAPVRKGNVVCENVIRKNRDADGGEAVLVETPESLRSLERTADGDVSVREFDLPRED